MHIEFCYVQVWVQEPCIMLHNILKMKRIVMYLILENYLILVICNTTANNYVKA